MIKLMEKDQWTGPAGKRVTVGFHCLAYKKDFKTFGTGQRSWNKDQIPGVRAARMHARGSRHMKKHDVWISQKPVNAEDADSGPTKRIRDNNVSRSCPSFAYYLMFIVTIYV